MSIRPAYLPIDDGYWTAAPNPHLNEQSRASEIRGRIMTTTLHRVVIVGAGRGGRETPPRLAGAPVRITLLGRRNHHLFPPLPYQVATASLASSDSACAVRHLRRDRREVTTLFATVTGVAASRR